MQASDEWQSTAIFVTFDESGGYFDSGYVQPLDFFGDGTRIPSYHFAFTTGGHVNHSYADHVSLTKFIERNWHLGPLNSRSRDNDPNPIASKNNPYVPPNTPAIDDLFDAFNFGRSNELNEPALRSKKSPLERRRAEAIEALRCSCKT